MVYLIMHQVDTTHVVVRIACSTRELAENIIENDLVKLHKDHLVGMGYSSDDYWIKEMDVF